MPTAPVASFQTLYPNNPDPNQPDTEVLHEFASRLSGRVRGELDFTTTARALYSTDAGNYRVVPSVVFAPVDKAEAVLAINTARDLGMPITPRGSGTSCAGNAIGPGLVIDFLRHMNRVISVDPQKKTAIVEPGCIEATLQQAAGQYGLRFGPDPSTQNRCTIGGMVGNNACGPHATAWGKTSENIVSLEVVDGHGRHFTAGQGSLATVPGLQELIEANLAPIRTEMGRFGRQVSGYSLEYLLPENGGNLAGMLVGTEGTLACVLEVEVKLVDIPRAPVLVAIGYPNMIEAGRDVPAILAHKPLAVEGLDKRLVDVVRVHKGPGAVPELPAGEGWLMCEIGGADLDDAMRRAQAMAGSANSSAVAIYPPGEDAARLWRIRADGAGLGGRTPVELDSDGNVVGGNEQAWPGWEDAAVPPENLGDYLEDFTALMDNYGINGLLYGHFGDGCVHVRLDMPLGSQAGVGKSKEFLIDSAKLLGKYGGSVSGEHGDGRSRSELLKYMYSPQMLQLFAAVKHLFDPENLMNPGVLTRPQPLVGPAGSHPDHHAFEQLQKEIAPDNLEIGLRRPAAKTIPAATGFQFRHDHADFTTAVHRCTGVSKCRADNSGGGEFMCPSFNATKNEIDSTRGRARVLEELANGELIATWDDPRVSRALDLCLACKACAADCPAGIDMAKYRSEVYYRRYRGKVRPASHYLLGRLPVWTRLTATIPGMAAIANTAMRIPPIRNLAFKIAGIDSRRQMPHLQSHLFNNWAPKHTCARKASSAPRSDNGKKYVVLWADSFSQSVNDAGARDMIAVLVSAGYTPLLPPQDLCCGLTWITTGQLDTAREKITTLVEQLTPFALAGIPIVGVEPSCTAVLRDDALDLNIDAEVEAVSSAVYTLAELLTAPAPIGPDSTDWMPNLTGKEVVAQPHCHHYSVMGWDADETLLNRAGAKLIKLSGCCGLAGNFGMEAGHYETSVKVAQQSLLPTLAQHPDAIYLADGFSCRTQAGQLAGRGGVHLASLIKQNQNGPGTSS
ncbi:FAD-linked oxidase C-terminal domain-containing protein [Actinomyces sp.]|uniref:FAD-binding and (Fe-S)-binding domain-containing protein n=1 Tax=Actinomyces sp. TaxID=29317 RepID=UPI0029138855|nr:FAD-linked oxidase C-terminal domain-containing protein [Actinomyces sp.]MDU6678972.1 FAD-linked oxidase C-terminal domain-containing protein [Actinomyces sp.]